MEPTQLIITETGEPSDELRVLLAKCRELKEAIRESEELTKQLEEKNATIKELQTVTIPRFLEALELTELTFGNGLKVKLKDEVFANITKEKMPEVVAWLRERNMAGIVKTTAAIDVGQIDKAKELGLTVTESHSIHHATLGSFVRERIAVDPNFPKAMFSVSQRNVAVIAKS